MSTDTREERLARRIADLYATDRQFADARPSEAITAAIDQPGLRLPQIVRTVMEGYADRPALAQRAVQFVNDPQTGRTSVELLPRFETTSYRELWDRVGAVATALAGGPSPSVRPGDRVCVLGFTSVDYTIIDVALVLMGAVCVPLQTSAPVTQLRPIVAETEPSVIAASVDYLDDAVELVLTGHAPARLVVFDYHPRGRRPARGVRRRPVAVGASGQPGECGNAGRRARPREGAASRTGVRRRRRRPVDAADLHLRQHRRTEGRHATRAPGRQLLAQSRAVVGPAAQRRAVDHAQLHADEPLDGAGHPVRDARQRRHGLFRGQERSLDPLGRPRAGAAHPVGLRAADLGHAVRGVPERTGPALVQRRRSRGTGSDGDGRAAAEPARRTVRLGD